MTINDLVLKLLEIPNQHQNIYIYDEVGFPEEVKNVEMVVYRENKLTSAYNGKPEVYVPLIIGEE